MIVPRTPPYCVRVISAEGILAVAHDDDHAHASANHSVRLAYTFGELLARIASTHWKVEWKRSLSITKSFCLFLFEVCHGGLRSLHYYGLCGSLLAPEKR